MMSEPPQSLHHQTIPEWEEAPLSQACSQRMQLLPQVLRIWPGIPAQLGALHINTSMLKRVPPLFTNLHMVAGKLRLGGQRLVWEVLVETLMGIHLLAR